MTKKMLIDATHAEETRVVVLDGSKVDEFDFESLNKRQLAGNIYLAKVTRVEPSLQAAFVDYGGNRHGFLAFSEIHPDYYQIPKADREALLAEEAALAREADDEPAAEAAAPKAEAKAEARTEAKGRSRSRSRKRSLASAEGTPASEDAVLASAPAEAAATGPDPAEDPAPDAETPAAEAAGQRPDAGYDDRAGAEDDETMLVETPEDMANSPEYEQIGGQDSVADERPVRKPRPRRYKIQEVIKVRQILLVQVIKEERGNKGAALTTYLSLAGRYCVLMPNTARGGGISRKITNATVRKKLKEISNSIIVPEGAGLIIRTAGANRTKTEIKRDFEYLLRQWEQIRDLTLKSIAPCLIYEEGSLIKRVIRDLYSRDIDEVLVDGDRGYREAKDYMKMLMPSHAKNVKHYADPLPLFSRFQVENYLNGMFNPVVQLKSGGYIVIDVTEALVAIDVNSGRATREASIEDTALKTNLEAAEEAARQMRLRDLAGLIVIDFIDMDERKNNSAVEKRLKDKLKTDRARIQVGRISAFGLLEMSRQRLRPGMIEATTKGCPHCHGTGRVRSDDSVALALLREVEEEGVRQRSKEVLVSAPVEIANYLLNQKREHIIRIESRFGLSVRVEGDPSLINPDYRLERFKTASRIISTPEGLVLPPPVIEEDEDEDVIDEAVEIAEEEEEKPAAASTSEDKSQPKKKRRRRRRGGAKGRDGAEEQIAEARSEDDAAAVVEDDSAPVAAEAAQGSAAAEIRGAAEAPAEGADAADAADAAAAPEAGATPARAAAAAGSGSDAFGEVIDIETDTAPDIVSVPESGVTEKPARRPRVSQPAAAVIAEVQFTPAAAPDGAADETLAETAEPEAPAAEPEAPAAEPEEPAAEPETPQPLAAAPEEQASGYALDGGPERDADLPPQELVPASDHPSEGEASAGDEPKRRGWWSRA